MLDAKIETFLRVAELNSFTAAAETLHLTQPAVSQHIHKLETHYGCKLIDSTHKAMHLTNEGNLLYEYLSLQRANERCFSQLLHNTIEPLRIGATLSIADYYLPEILINQMLSSGERIRVTVGNTAHLLEALRTGELDCAFIEGLFHSALFESHVFCQARFLPVASVKHPLAGKTISLEELQQYPIILREPNSGTREVFENWLHLQNAEAKSFAQVTELGSFVLIKKLIQHSSAVTFVYEAVVKTELEHGKLCALALKDFDLTHALCYVYRKGDIRRPVLEKIFEQTLK